MADPVVRKSYEAEEVKEEVKIDEITVESEEMAPDEVSDIIKTLERVTMELPKLVLNEDGEYVAAE